MKGIAFLFLAVFVLFGCVFQEQWIQERFQCKALSPPSFATVPYCNTPEKCFSLLFQSLFSFDASFLRPALREELFVLKNEVARAWHFFNLARENAENIQQICALADSPDELVLQVNELQAHLLLAFSASASFQKKSLLLLASEKNALGKEDVNFVREESVFQHYVFFCLKP
jgi:hypothetical protein